MKPISKDPRYTKLQNLDWSCTQLLLDHEDQRDPNIWTSQLKSFLRKWVRPAAQANLEAIYLMHSVHCIDGKAAGSRVFKRMVWRHPLASNVQLHLEPGSPLPGEVRPLSITAQLEDEAIGYLIAMALWWAERLSTRPQYQTSNTIWHRRNHKVSEPRETLGFHCVILSKQPSVCDPWAISKWGHNR